MREKEMQKEEKESNRTEKENPSFCSKGLDIITFTTGNVFAYLFFMLLYTILIYYGLTTIITNYILEMIEVTQLLIIYSFLLGFLFLGVMIFSYHYGKFGFLYSMLKMLLGIIISNIGIIWFLSEQFALTTMQIIDLFVYMMLISMIISIFAYFLVRVLIKMRCNLD